MMTHTVEEINKALEQHQLYRAYQEWLQAIPETRGEEPPKGIRFALKDLSGADLSGADLRGADLWKADLEEADLSGADLWKADLRGADLSGANLWRADLEKANLKEASLEGASLEEASLWRADLEKANLRGADLEKANLRGADLEGANLIEADLIEADLRGADLRKVDLREADLRWAIGNGQEVKSIRANKYPIVWTNTELAIGCQQHPLADWLDFSDEEKSKFANDALEYLNKWLPILDSMGVFDSVKRKETE